MLNFSDQPVSELSPTFTPTQYLQYVYLDFNLNVPICWKCITCLVFLTGNSFSKYVYAGRGWQHLSNNNFCKNRMTESMKRKVYERACERLIESVIKFYVFPVLSLEAIFIFFFRLGFLFLILL